MYLTSVARKERKMILKIRINVTEIVIEAEPDECSFYTILNVLPEKAELKRNDAIYLDMGSEKFYANVITGPMYFNDRSTMKNICYVANYPTNIIGWQQLKDMGLLTVNKNRMHVVDVPPVLIEGENPGYAKETYLKRHLIGDAKRVIASWVRKGIIERHGSVCNSPVTLTTKPNGKVKIIFHYYDLNRCTKQEPPGWEQNRHTVIASVPLGSFYSVIGLYYGEWQIPLDTNTKYKTAFTFLGQQYIWNCLPGKFLNTAAILTKTLGLILDKLPQNVRKHITYYRDKMLISADNKKECRKFTDLLWSHLEDNGFEIQETENQICQSQVEYLGREITPKGYRFGESYLQKVCEICSPRSAKELWSILATLEDARRLTPGFGVFAADLYKLRNENNWCWDDEHQELLNALIHEILKNRMVVPWLTEKCRCIVEIFVIGEAWMAEVSNSARRPYFSESGTFTPVKKQQRKAVRELKAMCKVWRKIGGEMNDRNVTWEVECPEVARYKDDPNSLEVNKKLDLNFIFSSKHKIEVVSGERKPPIQLPGFF